MKWIGLTGGIGTGKSTLTNILRKKGYKVVDADELARLAVSPGSEGLKKVVNLFGPSSLLASGEMDRVYVGKKVFENKALLEKLENIIHPQVKLMAKSKRDEYEKSGLELAFYDVPLLFEKKLQDQFDKIAVISCDESKQIERLKKRTALDEEQIKKMIQSQLPIKSKESLADYVIDNNGSLEDLEKNVDKFLEFVHKN